MKKLEVAESLCDNASICSSIYQIEKPKIVENEYYWQGKDYSNCYKEDFKELEYFSKGMKIYSKIKPLLNKLYLICITLKINSTELKHTVCLGAMRLFVYLVKVPETWHVILLCAGTTAK